MRVDFAIEPLASIWDDIMRLASAHWEETEAYRHGQQFRPDKDRYLKMDASGWYFMTTARYMGQLVGYAGMYVMPSMHTQRMVAMEDTYFLLPEARRGRVAIAFYKFIERECLKRGAVECTMTAKLTNKAGKILEYLDFSPTAMQYSKQFPPPIGTDSPATLAEIADVCT